MARRKWRIGFSLAAAALGAVYAERPDDLEDFGNHQLSGSGIIGVQDEGGGLFGGKSEGQPVEDTTASMRTNQTGNTERSRGANEEATARVVIGGKHDGRRGDGAGARKSRQEGGSPSRDNSEGGAQQSEPASREGSQGATEEATASMGLGDKQDDGGEEAGDSTTNAVGGGNEGDGGGGGEGGNPDFAATAALGKDEINSDEVQLEGNDKVASNEYEDLTSKSIKSSRMAGGRFSAASAASASGGPLPEYVGRKKLTDQMKTNLEDNVRLLNKIIDVAAVQSEESRVHATKIDNLLHELEGSLAPFSHKTDQVVKAVKTIKSKIKQSLVEQEWPRLYDFQEVTSGFP